VSEKVVMYDSDEAATRRTVEGWVSRDGLFCGNNEHAARYAGCTHRTCEKCGEPYKKKGWCEPCYEKKRTAKYEALEYVEWEDQVVYDYDGNEYFFSEDEFLSWCEDHDIPPESVRLQVCDPQYVSEIELEYHLEEVLPPDAEPADVLPKEALEAISKFNEIVGRKDRAVSWYPSGKQRTRYAP